MKVWLCPVKPRSWNIIRKKKVFGAPIRASEAMQLIRPGDLLAFHVLRPTHGIVAVYQATPRVYEDYEDIWGKERYPLRVKIEPFRDRSITFHLHVRELSLGSILFLGFCLAFLRTKRLRKHPSKDERASHCNVSLF
jgi:hypothetical protein